MPSHHHARPPSFFFFNDTATTEIYTLSLHDALPILTLDEMVRLFAFEGIQKKPAIFDMTKLEWMNGQYLSMTSADELYPLVAPQLQQLGLNGNKDAVLKAIAAVKTRSRTTLDGAKQVALPPDPEFVTFDDKAKKEVAKGPAGQKAALEASLPVLRHNHC